MTPGAAPHTARRTCIVCRDEEDRDDLVRLVRHPETGRAVVDLRANLPGRGAWVHPRRACVEGAERPAVLSRALKEPTEATGLAAELREAVWRALLDGLSLAAAGGGLVGGHDVLEQALREGRIESVIAAEDASERTLADLSATAGVVPMIRIPLTKAALGTRVGSAPRAAVGVVVIPATHHLRRQLRRWLALG